MPTTTSISALNQVDSADFTRLLGGIFEHSPWIAQGAAAGRPYATLRALHAAMQAQVNAADEQAKLTLIQAHPELAGKAALRGELTAESTREQQGAGLNLCSAEEFKRLHALNRAYNEKFGFPFIVAVRGHTRESILNVMQQRLHNDRATELQACLQQIEQIALLRLQDMVAED